eukprot:scpid105511/ scgid21776/ 
MAVTVDARQHKKLAAIANCDQQLATSDSQRNVYPFQQDQEKVHVYHHQQRSYDPQGVVNCRHLGMNNKYWRCILHAICTLSCHTCLQDRCTSQILNASTVSLLVLKLI